MVSLGEILRADPSKITFDTGKPPAIGEVPIHTYGMLLDVHHLELLDGPEDVIDNTVPDTEPLSREEELRRELQSVSDTYRVPTTAAVETDTMATIFQRKAPFANAISKPTSRSKDKPQKKHDMAPNQKNHQDNLRVFSGRLGNRVYERGTAVRRRKR